MGSIYSYLPFDEAQATLIKTSLCQLIGPGIEDNQSLIQAYWLKIKSAAIAAESAIRLESIDIAKQKRAGQKLMRIAKTRYPRYRHDREVMALLFLGAIRKGYITSTLKPMDEKKYRAALFELSPGELRESAVEAYKAELTSQSKLPIVASDEGGRPTGRHFIEYARLILDIFSSAANAHLVNPSIRQPLTEVIFLEQCLAPPILSSHPFKSTLSLVERASI